MLCDKESFSNEKEATEKMISLKKRKPKYKYRTYKCTICGKLHISTINKKVLNKKVHTKESQLPPQNAIPQKARQVKVVPLATEKLLSKEMAQVLKNKIMMRNIAENNTDI